MPRAGWGPSCGAPSTAAAGVRGDGGSFLYEPELHFGEDALVPDLAGWRRERVPVLPRAAAMTLARGSDARLLEAYRRQEATWLRVAVHSENDIAPIPPFEAINFELGALWEGVA